MNDSRTEEAALSHNTGSCSCIRHPVLGSAPGVRSCTLGILSKAFLWSEYSKFVHLSRGLYTSCLVVCSPRRRRPQVRYQELQPCGRSFSNCPCTQSMVAVLSSYPACMKCLASRRFSVMLLEVGADTAFITCCRTLAREQAPDRQVNSRDRSRKAVSNDAREETDRRDEEKCEERADGALLLFTLDHPSVNLGQNSHAAGNMKLGLTCYMHDSLCLRRCQVQDNRLPACHIPVITLQHNRYSEAAQ